MSEAFQVLPADAVKPQFVTLREAAGIFGFRSPDAMRQAFRRGTLPERYLLRIGRACRVDVAGLAEYLRRQAETREAQYDASRTSADAPACPQIRH